MQDAEDLPYAPGLAVVFEDLVRIAGHADRERPTVLVDGGRVAEPGVRGALLVEQPAARVLDPLRLDLLCLPEMGLGRDELREGLVDGLERRRRSCGRHRRGGREDDGIAHRHEFALTRELLIAAAASQDAPSSTSTLPVATRDLNVHAIERSPRRM